MTDLRRFIVAKEGKMKKRRLREAVEHTPEKINEYVAKATKDVQDLQKIFTAFKGKVENLSIASMLSNPSEAESLYEKVKTAKSYAKQKYEYYFDIVEPYDFMDMPKNVKQLDKLVQKLDSLQDNLGYTMYAMDSMVDAAKDFNKFYQIEDEES